MKYGALRRSLESTYKYDIGVVSHWNKADRYVHGPEYESLERVID